MPGNVSHVFRGSMGNPGDDGEKLTFEIKVGILNPRVLWEVFVKNLFGTFY